MIEVTHRRAVLAIVAILLMHADPAGAVVGPSFDASDQASSVVMVLNHVGRTAGFCTGLVIAPTVVLTAAHCVPPDAELRIHYPEAGRDPVMLPVGAVVRHPDYRPDAVRTRERSIDLAVLRLPAALPSRFAPSRLSPADRVTPGARFTMAGYGVTREGDGASSGRLRGATLRARAPLSTVLLWADDAAQRGAGACTGDSGAPVRAEGSRDVSALVLWSAGRGDRHCGDLTQALWLAPQRAWLDRVLESWGAASAF